MLYAVTDLTYPTETNRYTLEPGKLGCLPITLASGGLLTIKANQLYADPLHLPQDNSIRGWVSTRKGGNPVVDSPLEASRWNITGLQKRVVTLFDMLGSAPSVEHTSIGLMPGSYCLNILNLVNEANSFALEITPDTGA